MCSNKKDRLTVRLRIGYNVLALKYYTATYDKQTCSFQTQF